MWSNTFHLQQSTQLPCCYFELFLLTQADLKSPVANMPTTSKYLIQTHYKNTSISFKGFSPICSLDVKTKLMSSGIQSDRQKMRRRSFMCQTDVRWPVTLVCPC